MFYDLNDTKTKRTTGLGYGKRFGNLLNPATLASPPPTRYDLGSMFKKDTVAQAFSFGLSRDHFKKVYIKEDMHTDPCVPGPGKYDLQASLNMNKGLMYSCRPKTSKDTSF